MELIKPEDQWWWGGGALFPHSSVHTHINIILVFINIALTEKQGDISEILTLFLSG